MLATHKYSHHEPHRHPGFDSVRRPNVPMCWHGGIALFFLGGAEGGGPEGRKEWDDFIFIFFMSDTFPGFNPDRSLSDEPRRANRQNHDDWEDWRASPGLGSSGVSCSRDEFISWNSVGRLLKISCLPTINPVRALLAVANVSCDGTSLFVDSCRTHRDQCLSLKVNLV